MKTGILLVNLGTPNSPKPKDVYRYLIEFLTDKRVIDLPWWYRHLLVRGIIVPFRYKQSARSYEKIWTSEGSPLKFYGKRIQEKLQEVLGSKYVVELGMRYQEPSLSQCIERLISADVEKIIVFPLFPQYASATTGSVYEKVMEIVKNYYAFPELVFINQFATHPSLIQSFCEAASCYSLKSYDHVLFSFHGLPQSHIKKTDRKGECLVSGSCCEQVCFVNKSCYSAQCYGTARAIANKLSLCPSKFSISFQSRLGKDPWLEPFTSDVFHNLAKEGKKRVLVFCPSFVCDCLETIFEIGVEEQEKFQKMGGETLDLVPGLNDSPMWIHSLKEILQPYL